MAQALPSTDLPPERINHSRSSGRSIIPVLLSLFLLHLLIHYPGADDEAKLHMPPSRVLRSIAACFAEWIPRSVSSIMPLLRRSASIRGFEIISRIAKHVYVLQID
jgi:hypothetical protein